MDETVKTIITIIVILLYVIGLAICSYYMSSYNNNKCDRCCKFIKKYNVFGDRTDDDPRLYYNEV